MTGLLVFLVLLLIVMQSRLLQELLGVVIMAFLAAVAYGYFLSSTDRPPAEAPVIHQAPTVQAAPAAPAAPAASSGQYNFDPQQGPHRPPRPYRQQ